MLEAFIVVFVLQFIYLIMRITLWIDNVVHHLTGNEEGKYVTYLSRGNGLNCKSITRNAVKWILCVCHPGTKSELNTITFKTKGHRSLYCKTVPKKLLYDREIDRGQLKNSKSTTLGNKCLTVTPILKYKYL